MERKSIYTKLLLVFILATAVLAACQTNGPTPLARSQSTRPAPTAAGTDGLRNFTWLPDSTPRPISSEPAP